MVFSKIVAETLSIEEKKVQSAIQLLDDGATVPFIARYRKDQTGLLDEIQLRDIQHRYEYFKELEERKDTVIKTIEEQGKLTPELSKQIKSCIDKVKLEDIYLPYKPKRRTRATVAKENGLEPLARIIEAQEETSNTDEEIARIYYNEEKGLTSSKLIIQGALDILAEEISENAEFRQVIRDRFEKEGQLVSKVRKEFEKTKGKFENYYDFSEPVAKCPSHRVLAIRRGEKEKVLRIGIELEESGSVSFLANKVVKGPSIWKKHIEACCEDAFNRLIKPSIETEVRLLLKNRAEQEALKVFGKNLEDVLLAAPAGQKSVVALDPGFKSGVKVAVMDKQGKFVDQSVIYPNAPQNQTLQSGQILKNLIEQHNVEMIAIGNGTASRETDAFAAKLISNFEASKRPIKVVVSEAGASVYSASPEAVKEFPKEDVTTRGAISIGRRLQDPLAELVKVDPKSIGVGQYQHDVNQKNLKVSLDEVVESCVNRVGVDLNTASAPLLSYVAGISKLIAQSIVKYRDENGAFTSRAQVLKVPKFGPKAFEQAAGFLRVTGGDNVLDASSVHPENYATIEEIVKDLGTDLASVIGKASEISKINKSKYEEKVGKHTLEDILDELVKPNRDPRSEFKYASFNDKIQTINDLVTDSWMEGVVTNVTNFGAFVDVGVHQDGLVHISELTDQFIEDAKEVLKVGDIVKARVIAVDVAQKRIALSLKSDSKEGSLPQRSKKGSGQKQKSHTNSTPTLADLKQKFKGSKDNGNKNSAKKPKISIKSIMR